MSDAQESPKPSGGGILGCFVILLIIAAMLGLPFGAFMLIKDGSGGMAWPFLGMGFAIFGLMALGALRSGNLPAKGRRISRAESPVTFFIGLTIYGLCALAMYIGYIISMFC